MAVPEPAACTLALKVIPNASRDEVAGWLGTTLKLKVRAPALDGRANAALTEFLADQLRLPRRAVTLVRGAKSRQKLVHISGLTLDQARATLGRSASAVP
jgi:uncharacterized protein (TIGR00251 family)